MARPVPRQRRGGISIPTGEADALRARLRQVLEQREKLEATREILDADVAQLEAMLQDLSLLERDLLQQLAIASNITRRSED